MTPLERRALLLSRPNPLPKADYLAMLEGRMGDRTMTLAYVPDRLVLPPETLASYLAVLDGLSWPSLEALGAVLLEDINDVLVPRWLRVTLCREDGGIRHRLRLEDRQPRWDNDRVVRDT